MISGNQHNLARIGIGAIRNPSSHLIPHRIYRIHLAVSIWLYRFWVNLDLTLGLSSLDLVSIQPRVQQDRPLIEP
ncbi:hypothetical protein AMR42_14955 [Limnothrix sp. PR1529]|nr:hypothetical protein BCR12_09270 [Limnothrix sp. P13C2]PIB06421.1 hypothetical protein AMR42_14955 [Limnothrix sp. PR1529]